jgi:hypothetical protein
MLNSQIGGIDIHAHALEQLHASAPMKGSAGTAYDVGLGFDGSESLLLAGTGMHMGGMGAGWMAWGWHGWTTSRRTAAHALLALVIATFRCASVASV